MKESYSLRLRQFGLFAKRVGYKIWPLLYPDHCPFCNRLLPYGRHICRSCFQNLPYTGDRICYCCGKPISKEEQELCYDCRVFPKSFQGGCSLYLYNEVTKAAIMGLKYHNRRSIARFLGTELFLYQKERFQLWHIQAVIPIPVHKNKRKKRGYNQAELIARELSQLLGVPCLSDLLLRCIDTPPQKELSPQARLINLQKAFLFHSDSRYRSILPHLHSVLLIDDIYTTGATMESCTRILHAAGIPHVYVASVCIGLSRD